MTTLNISLSESMREFINQQITKKGFSTEDEYIRHLIGQEQKRVAKSRLEELLIEGLESGEAIEITDEWWEQKRTDLAQRLHQQKK